MAQDAVLLLSFSTGSALPQAFVTTSRLTEGPGGGRTGGHSDPRLQGLEVVRTEGRRGEDGKGRRLREMERRETHSERRREALAGRDRRYRACSGPTLGARVNSGQPEGTTETVN